MENREKYLSFVVPCYNSESYMARCIESLLPGGEDVEIIIIDDGSKDKTVEIADAYQKQSPDLVKVIHKENGGHGSGVNAGLACARGVYFKVVDSDDWVDVPALHKALDKLRQEGIFKKLPLRGYVAAVSCGMVNDNPLLDLCYVEDSGAQVDFNFIMDDKGNIIELQGTGEERPFSKKEMDAMYALAEKGIGELIAAQKETIGDLL